MTRAVLDVIVVNYKDNGPHLMAIPMITHTHILCHRVLSHHPYQLISPHPNGLWFIIWTIVVGTLLGIPNSSENANQASSPLWGQLTLVCASGSIIDCLCVWTYWQCPWAVTKCVPFVSNHDPTVWLTPYCFAQHVRSLVHCCRCVPTLWGIEHTHTHTHFVFGKNLSQLHYKSPLTVSLQTQWNVGATRTLHNTDTSQCLI